MWIERNKVVWLRRMSLDEEHSSSRRSSPVCECLVFALDDSATPSSTYSSRSARLSLFITRTRNGDGLRCPSKWTGRTGGYLRPLYWYENERLSIRVMPRGEVNDSGQITSMYWDITRVYFFNVQWTFSLVVELARKGRRSKKNSVKTSWLHHSTNFRFIGIESPNSVHSRRSSQGE